MSPSFLEIFFYSAPLSLKLRKTEENLITYHFVLFV